MVKQRVGYKYDGVYTRSTMFLRSVSCHVKPCETSKCKLTTSQMAFETAIAGVAVLQGVA